jgi:hypothetical protein
MVIAANVMFLCMWYLFPNPLLFPDDSFLTDPSIPGSFAGKMKTGDGKFLPLTRNILSFKNI